MKTVELQDRGMSSPLSVELNDGVYLGQFYNSWDKKYHLAEFIPYEMPPRSFLCKAVPANFSPSREKNYQQHRPKCEKCFKLAERKLNALRN